MKPLTLENLEVHVYSAPYDGTEEVTIHRVSSGSDWIVAKFRRSSLIQALKPGKGFVYPNTRFNGWLSHYTFVTPQAALNDYVRYLNEKQAQEEQKWKEVDGA